MDDQQLRQALRAWRDALAARATTMPGGHDWANAEMAVRFWRGEVRDANAARRGGPLGHRYRRMSTTVKGVEPHLVETVDRRS